MSKKTVKCEIDPANPPPLMARQKAQAAAPNLPTRRPTNRNWRLLCSGISGSKALVVSSRRQRPALVM